MIDLQYDYERMDGTAFFGSRRVSPEGAATIFDKFEGRSASLYAPLDKDTTLVMFRHGPESGVLTYDVFLKDHARATSRFARVTAERARAFLLEAVAGHVDVDKLERDALFHETERWDPARDPRYWLGRTPEKWLERSGGRAVRE